MATEGKADPMGRDVRKVLRHIRRAYDLVTYLGNFTCDDVGTVTVQESLRAAYEDVRDYGVHQLGVDLPARGRR